MHYIWIYSIRIEMIGDIERNAEPKPSLCNKFSICHSNLNSISAHNFMELSLLHFYIFIHNFNILWLSETYHGSTISSNNSNLSADHPSNVKREGICIYYTNCLPLKVTKVGEKLRNLVALYRSPSQSQDECEIFAKKTLS